MSEEGDAGRRLWETLHAALGVEGYLDHWWQFAWDELPAELQDELVDAARRLEQGERDALCAALVQEYADILAQRGSWRWHGSHTTEPEALRLPYLRGARDALWRLAARLDITDLHEQAADVVAHGRGEGAS